MAAFSLRRLYAPEFMVKENLKQGEIPGTKAAYSTAFAIAWASILECFLIALISMADTIMVSVEGKEAIAAVGLVTQPRFIVQSLVLSLNVAVTSICARRKGEGDGYGAGHCLKQGLVVSAGLSLLLTFLVMPFSRQLLFFAGAQPDTIELAKGYFDILLLGIPFSSLSLTICSAQRGIGETRFSMIVNMTANVVNLIFNYLLIGGRLGFPKLGVTGAAVATVIGWGFGLVLAVLSVSRKGRFLYIFSRDGWKFEKETMHSMYKVASGSFLEQLCMRVGFLTYAKVVAGLGTTMFATHQILTNLMSLSFSFGEGFGIAASSLVGQGLGMGRADLSIVYGKTCQRMSFISSAAIFVVLTFWGRPMLGLFTDDPEIIRVGSTILILVCLIIVGQSNQMIFMGALRGAGDTRYTAVVSLICIMLVRPIAAWILGYPVGLGLLGIWLGFLLDQYLRLYLTHRRFSSGDWKTIKL